MQYIILGIGGQGVLFASKVLGHIALSRGHKVQASEVHGMAQRGGSVVSHFKEGDFASPLVMPGQADVILAFDQNEAVRGLEFLKPGGTLVVNIHDQEAWNNEPLQSWLKDRGAHVSALPGYRILDEHMEGKYLFMNVLILGALAGSAAHDATYEEMERAVAALAPAKFKEANLNVLRLGYEAVGGK